MFVCEFEGKTPQIHPTVFVAPSAFVIGDVIIGKGSSVWPGAVIRGDVNNITIGKYTSIQDNAVVHVTPQNLTKIGDYVTVGHGAVVHAATVENNTLIGMKAVLLDGAKINKNSIIGAGSVVLENTEFPANCLVVGIPGKIVRALNSSKQKKDAQMHASFYSQLAQKHKKNLEKE